MKLEIKKDRIVYVFSRKFYNRTYVKVLRYYPPKSSKSIISSSTPKSCSIPVTAEFIIGGPHI